jgi:hypothetical protein
MLQARVVSPVKAITRAIIYKSANLCSFVQIMMYL